MLEAPARPRRPSQGRTSIFQSSFLTSDTLPGDQDCSRPMIGTNTVVMRRIAKVVPIHEEYQNNVVAAMDHPAAFGTVHHGPL